MRLDIFDQTRRNILHDLVANLQNKSREDAKITLESLLVNDVARYQSTSACESEDDVHFRAILNLLIKNLKEEAKLRDNLQVINKELVATAMQRELEKKVLKKSEIEEKKRKRSAEKRQKKGGRKKLEIDVTQNSDVATEAFERA